MRSLTQQQLMDNFIYAPSTGTFTYIGKRVRKNITTYYNDRGYIKIFVNGHRYHASHLAHLYMTGSMPVAYMDHTNHVRDDNRWCNLRPTTHAANMKNRSLQKNSGGIILGVNWIEVRKKYKAYIGVHGKQLLLGEYSEYWDAMCVRKSAEAKYGYHPNHGAA